jgi:hypothetical protein
MEATSDRFATVAWVYDAGELGLLLSLFEWEQIPVVPLGYHHTAVQWNIIIALGGVRLQVREEDVPAALALLASLERTPQKSVRFFARDKMVDVLLTLLVFFLCGLAVPARIQADFAVARRERSA